MQKETKYQKTPKARMHTWKDAHDSYSYSCSVGQNAKEQYIYKWEGQSLKKNASERCVAINNNNNFNIN